MTLNNRNEKKETFLVIFVEFKLVLSIACLHFMNILYIFYFLFIFVLSLFFSLFLLSE